MRSFVRIYLIQVASILQAQASSTTPDFSNLGPQTMFQENLAFINYQIGLEETINITAQQVIERFGR